MNEILDFNLHCKCRSIWTCFGNIIRKMENLFPSAVFLIIMESAMFCCITKTFCPETLKLLWGSFYWNPCWNRCEYRDSRVSENKWEPFYWDINYQSSVIPDQRWKVLSVSIILRKRMAMEARNSVSLSQIYFPIVLESTHTNFNMFSQWTHIAV